MLSALEKYRKSAYYSSMNLYTAAITLFLVMDPFGNIPVFFSSLSVVEPERRNKVLIRELIIALMVLVFFFFFGKFILDGLHLSQPALTISGGIILFLIAIKMIFPASQGPQEASSRDEPFIVPLAIPLIAGPSAMAMVMLFSTSTEMNTYTGLAALLISWSLTSFILGGAVQLHRFIKPRLLLALERLMGMILTTLAIQMLLNGIEALL